MQAPLFSIYLHPNALTLGPQINLAVNPMDRLNLAALATNLQIELATLKAKIKLRPQQDGETPAAYDRFCADHRHMTEQLKKINAGLQHGEVPELVKAMVRKNVTDGLGYCMHGLQLRIAAAARLVSMPMTLRGCIDRFREQIVKEIGATVAANSPRQQYNGAHEAGHLATKVREEWPAAFVADAHADGFASSTPLGILRGYGLNALLERFTLGNIVTYIVDIIKGDEYRGRVAEGYGSDFYLQVFDRYKVLIDSECSLADFMQNIMITTEDEDDDDEIKVVDIDHAELIGVITQSLITQDLFKDTINKRFAVKFQVGSPSNGILYVKWVERVRICNSMGYFPANEYNKGEVDPLVRLDIGESSWIFPASLLRHFQAKINHFSVENYIFRLMPGMSTFLSMHSQSDVDMHLVTTEFLFESINTVPKLRYALGRLRVAENNLQQDQLLKLVKRLVAPQNAETYNYLLVGLDVGINAELVKAIIEQAVEVLRIDNDTFLRLTRCVSPPIYRMIVSAFTARAAIADNDKRSEYTAAEVLRMLMNTSTVNYQFLVRWIRSFKEPLKAEVMRTVITSDALLPYELEELLKQLDAVGVIFYKLTKTKDLLMNMPLKNMEVFCQVLKKPSQAAELTTDKLIFIECLVQLPPNKMAIILRVMHENFEEAYYGKSTEDLILILQCHGVDNKKLLIDLLGQARLIKMVTNVAIAEKLYKILSSEEYGDYWINLRTAVFAGVQLENFNLPDSLKSFLHILRLATVEFQRWLISFLRHKICSLVNNCLKLNTLIKVLSADLTPTVIELFKISFSPLISSLAHLQIVFQTVGEMKARVMLLHLSNQINAILTCPEEIGMLVNVLPSACLPKFFELCDSKLANLITTKADVASMQSKVEAVGKKKRIGTLAKKYLVQSKRKGSDDAGAEPKRNKESGVATQGVFAGGGGAAPAEARKGPKKL